MKIGSGHYTIKDLETITGIKSHTLRIWEKRYLLIAPSRTQSNIRFYSNDELRKVLNVHVLYQHGVKISQIAALSQVELLKRVLALQNTHVKKETLVPSFILSMLNLDETLFQKSFQTCLHKLGWEESMTKVFVPFFTQIGIMWQVGTVNPAQEHFISNLFRQKLISAIDQAPDKPKSGKKTILLFLPENEWHELSLLWYHLMLKQKGYPTLYLGQNVPIDNLDKCIQTVQPGAVLSIFTNSVSVKEWKNYIEKLENLKVPKILLSGRGVGVLGKSRKVKQFDHLNSLIALLK